MSATMCDRCHEQPSVKMVMIAVRTETSIDDERSANRMEFIQVPLCEACLKKRKAGNHVQLEAHSQR